MKQKIWTLALTVIVCLEVPTFGMSMPEQQSKKEKAERKDVLRTIYEIDNFCKKLASDIKVLEAADSLNEFVWEHRDSLNYLSEDTLDLFVSNLASTQIHFPLTNEHATNTDAWKDIVNEEVVKYVEAYFDFKAALLKLYNAFWEKKLRILDVCFAELKYSPNEPKTSAEKAKRMLASPEVRSSFGTLPIFYGMMKATRSTLKSMNTSNKNLLQVTDKDLSEMFGKEKEDNIGINFNFTR